MPALDAWRIAVLLLGTVSLGRLVVLLVCPSRSLCEVGSPSLALSGRIL